MALVALITDLGHKDWYTGILKSALHVQMPGVQIVDITHEIKPYDIENGGIVLAHAHMHFPPNTIFLTSVISWEIRNQPCIALKYNGQYFFAHNNGLLGLMLRDAKPDAIIDISGGKPHGTMAIKDTMVPAAARLTAGNPIHSLGPELDDLIRVNLPNLATGHDTIVGHIIYIDHFGNAHTDLHRDQVNAFVQGRPFEIRLWRNSYVFETIYDNYTMTLSGDKSVVYNTMGFIEFCVRGGSAENLLGLYRGCEFRLQIKQ